MSGLPGIAGILRGDFTPRTGMVVSGSRRPPAEGGVDALLLPVANAGVAGLIFAPSFFRGVVGLVVVLLDGAGGDGAALAAAPPTLVLVTPDGAAT